MIIKVYGMICGWKDYLLSYYLFDSMININNLDPNKMETEEKSYECILIYYTGYVAPNSVKPFYIITDNAKGYIIKSKGNKYLIILHSDERKNTLKMYGELWSRTKDLIRLNSNKSGGYDKK